MRGLRRALAACAGLVVLWAPFVATINPANAKLVADWRPPALVLAALAVLAAAALGRRRLGRGLRWALAAVILVAALLQVVAALVQHFLDRSLDLYFDVPHLPSLFGLFTDAVGAMRADLAFALALGVMLGLLAAIAWALGAWQRALVSRQIAAGVLALTLGGLVLAALPIRLVATAAPAAVADQAARLYRAAAVMTGYDQRYQTALAAPAPAVADLAALRGRDVFLVYVESYGTAVLDEPDYRAVVAPALAAFAHTVEGAGYDLVSSRLTSPVFGGGSWLAHATVASGLKLDPFLYRFLTVSRRETLPRYLRAAGHRTVAVMPGIKNPWPEATFFGFERGYYATDLGYGGPPFGWFVIPDQYTLARFDEKELAPGHAPLFAEIVLVSSHTPFAPVPPYVADWSDAGPYKSIGQPEWKRIYREPDWAHLETPYLASVVYDLRTLAAWLAHIDGNGLVIILGDHQPPGIVSGATSPWTVPMHVLSRDPALIAPFVRAGYVAGAHAAEGAQG